MVSTTTSMVAHGQEGDKKRKQTLERAKAHHLCRQLQMRLQYARLKVEHGWQKQTLNEVENLYFHHSHQRGPKPFPSSLVATTTQPEPTAFAPSSGPQSSLSFISRNTGPIHAPVATSSARHAIPQSSNGTSPPRSASVTPKPKDSAARMPPPSTTPTPMVVDKGNPSNTRHAVPLTPTSPQRQPGSLQSMRASPLPQLPYTGYASTSATPRLSSAAPVSAVDKPPPLPATLRSPGSPSKSRSRGSKSKSSNATNGSGSSSTQKNANAASTSTSTSTAAGSSSSSSSMGGYAAPKDAAFNFGSSSTSGMMTYDAFWSNHATTAGLQTRIINGIGGGLGMVGSASAAATAGTASAGSLGQQT